MLFIKIIYHGGPTNSGKTYNALQRLKTANRGLYLGPLRLLAAEIYENLNAQGKTKKRPFTVPCWSSWAFLTYDLLAVLKRSLL